MKKKLFITAIICLALCAVVRVSGWGVWGHNHINKGAVLAVPKEMGMFFYNHVDFITEESSVPDLRKYTMHDKAEGCRHYIDLEFYSYSSPAAMPKTAAEAIAKYGKDSVDRYGILPWYIQEMTAKLTEAFKKKRKTEILLLAADLGHYVGDANMPLHTTINHNGQFTGQEGIHAFWESQLPELFGKNYNLNVGQALYIPNVEQATWNMIDSTYHLVNTLLATEKKMRNDNPDEKRYVKDADGSFKKNKFGQPVNTYEYAHVYHELLNGMVESQMRKAIRMTADLWYTAWVNAGKPDLTDLDPEYVTERNKVAYKEDMKALQKGKVRGCKSDKEF